MRPELHEANRRSWNAATVAHNSHKQDQAAFFRSGGSTLFPEEVELLGELSGRSLVHLQCNSGQDSLSLARLGARVTGVDISDEAHAFAEELSRASGIPAWFHRADVYEWLEESAQRGERYDLAFCSYGVLCWLSDLDRWARGVAAVLRSGGRFVCVEFHPFAMMFNEQWELRFAYASGAEPVMWREGVGDYVAGSGGDLTPSGLATGIADFRNPHPAYEFQWGIGQILTALLQAGLQLRVFREYPYANGWKAFERMRRLSHRRWAAPEGMPELPLMFGVVAEKA